MHNYHFLDELQASICIYELCGNPARYKIAWRKKAREMVNMWAEIRL